MRFIKLFFWTVFLSCSFAGGSYKLKPLKAENYNKKIKDVIIITSFDMISEKYENEFVIELRSQFTKDNIKNTNFSYSKNKLNTK